MVSSVVILCFLPRLDLQLSQVKHSTAWNQQSSTYTIQTTLTCTNNNQTSNNRSCQSQHQQPKPCVGTPQTTAPSAAGTSRSIHGTTTPTPATGAPPLPGPAAVPLDARTLAAVRPSVSTSTSAKPRSAAPSGAEAVTGLLVVRTIITCPGDIIIAQLPLRSL